MEMNRSLASLFWGRLLTEHEVKHSLQAIGQGDSYEAVIQELGAREAIVASDEGYRCGRCNNTDSHQFVRLDIPTTIQTEDLVYCLACIQMGRITKGKSLYYLPQAPAQERVKENSLLTWEGTLSAEQARGSQALIESLADTQRPHMIHAVTGAGKTEMIFPAIAHVLEAGGRVCVASPRIDVCLELAPRLQTAFKEVPVSLLYGHSEEAYTYTPLVVSTTHQLLRFAEAFDLLIVDEVDAFPYVNDSQLHFAVERAVQASGKLIYLTATPNQHLKDLVDNQQLTATVLPARYHGYPLPEPVFTWIGDWRHAIRTRNQQSELWRLLQEVLALEGVQLIFMPSIRLAEALFAWLQQSSSPYSMACVHAKDPERKVKVQALRDGAYQALITTTILERGVTFENCQVCIVGAESPLYSQAALVQMSGRVGRRPNYPTGQLIYAHGGISRAMKQAREEIQTMNAMGRKRGLLHHDQA